MNIGIDLRFLKDDDPYSGFVQSCVIRLIQTEPKHHYTLYLHPERSLPEVQDHGDVYATDILPGSFSEQTRLYSIFMKHDHQLMLFFDFHVPLHYNKAYYLMVQSLRDIFYQNFSGSLQKHLFLYRAQKSIEKSEKIIVFDQISGRELSERFNTREDKVHMLPGAFEHIPRMDDIKLDLGVTWGIKNPYFIYPGGGGIEKNLERFGDLIHKIRQTHDHIDFVILGDEACSNTSLRNKIIEHKLQNNTHFISGIEPRQLQLLYTQSLGVIYPSLYETFPFDLTLALHLDCPILISNLPSIRRILGDGVSYFSPISLSHMYGCIDAFLSENREHDYSGILATYNIGNSAKQLRELIEG